VTAYDSFQDDPRLSLAEGYVIKSTDFRGLKQQIANALRRKLEPQDRVESEPGKGSTFYFTIPMIGSYP
jgi:signal transduction histidine kinase